MATGDGDFGDGSSYLTPFDIFFNTSDNGYQILNVNFFNVSGTQEGSFVRNFRESVSLWFYAMRMIATIILLCILIYVGIRMALSSVAEDRAKYKKMLVDWVCSLALIFLLQYIALGIIYLNDALVKSLRAIIANGSDSGVQGFMADFMDKLAISSSLGAGITSIVSVFLYCGIVAQTIMFFIAYVNRMLKIGFLIIISPLISLTYSIDKMGDGKAQALNSWMKEFMLNVLIQPFHCILFLVFASASIELIQSDGSLAALVLSIICMGFINRGEKIIREIFGFSQASSLGETVASIAAVKTIGSAATKAGSTVMKNSKFGKNISNKISSSKFAQSKARKSNRHSWKFQQKSFAICCWRNECCIRSWT